MSSINIRAAVMALAGLINLLMPVTTVMVNSECDYSQEIQVGQTYFINNPEYPYLFGPQSACRWSSYSAPGTRIYLSCYDIQIPESSQCMEDRLSVSLNGTVDFSDAHNYCGTGKLSLVSSAHNMTVGLFSTAWSKGGRFSCSVTAGVEPTTSTSKPNYCDCGWKRELRITGGQETGVNEYPSMAGLVDSLSRVIRCGATILSRRYALTAAHCVYERDLNTLGVLVGEHDITTGAETNYTRLYRIEKITIHYAFKLDTLENDLAVLRTNQDIQFSLYVGPVCLPFQQTHNNFVDQSVTALGWGLLEEYGPRSDTLQKVDLKVVDTNQCARVITDKPVTDTNICTFAQDKDACQSDSGGPLLWTQTSLRRLFLVGVISFGRGCALDVPSVNVRVTAFLSWIVQQTPDADYCVK